MKYTYQYRPPGCSDYETRVFIGRWRAVVGDRVANVEEAQRDLAWWLRWAAYRVERWGR